METLSNTPEKLVEMVNKLLRMTGGNQLMNDKEKEDIHTMAKKEDAVVQRKDNPNILKNTPLKKRTNGRSPI